MCNHRQVPASAIRSPVEASARILFWPVAVAIGLASIAIARNAAGGGFGGQSAPNTILELCAGLSMLAAGFALMGGASRRAGLLFATAGCTWFLLEWNNPGSNSAFAFTVGLVCSALTPALVAHGALAYPGGRLQGTLERVAVGATYVTTGLVLGIGPALVFEPRLAGCARCPANLLATHSSPRLYDDLNKLGLYLGLAALIALAFLFARRLGRAGPFTMRRDGPVLVAALAFTLLVAWDYRHSLARRSLSNDPFDTRLWRGEAVALCALAAGVWWGRFRQRHARAEVARVVLELGRTPRPGAVRDLLARELGDPELELAYPRPHGGRYVGPSGEPASLETRPGRAVTPIVSNGRQLAALGLTESLIEESGLVNEVVSAARLALENEQLEAEVRAQLAELRRSRARIVETSDVERASLERDLHDGAQQRLVGLLFALRIAHAQLPLEADSTIAVHLRSAENELELALAEIRELAHGMHPVSLSEEGLAAALESLAERCSTRLELTGLPEERFTPAVEGAAYLLVAEAVKGVEYCNGSGVTVTASRRDDRLIVHLAAEGWDDQDAERAAKLLDLDDRVRAADGRLGVATGDCVELVGDLPCG